MNHQYLLRFNNFSFWGMILLSQLINYLNSEIKHSITQTLPVCHAYLLIPWMIILIRSPCSTISVMCTKVPTLKMSSKLVTTSSSLQHVQLNIILPCRVNQICTFLFSLKMLRHMVNAVSASSLSSLSCQDLTPVRCMLCMYLIHCLHKLVIVYFQHLHKTGKYGATRYGQKWNIRKFIGCVEFCKCSLVWVFLST